MADVSVTDPQVSGSIQISDNSPFALAQLKHLTFPHLPVVGDFARPVDQVTLDQVEVGVGISSPSIAIGTGLGLVVDTGVNATFSVYTQKHKTLFGDDDFAPVLTIKASECWAGLCLKASLQDAITFKSPNGFGLSLNGGTSLTVGTFVHFPYPVPSTGGVIPLLKEGLVEVLQQFRIPATAAQMRAIPSGVVHTAEATGSVGLGASYSVPLTVSPFATLGLPFNLSLKATPNVALTVKGSITLTGSFITRAYRSADTKLVVGLYKKHETMLSASLTASAGVSVDEGKTDILASILDAIAPATGIEDFHLDEGDKKDLSAGLKQCVDESIAIGLNAACSATNTDEAAVIYEVDLNKGDLSVTDAALAAALNGDWSKLEGLPNATAVRHILRDLTKRNHKMNINLLGLYNATSITQYVKSATVIQNEHGDIALIDKVAAQKLSAGTTPYATKPDKLRSLLASDFIATVTYGACVGKLGVAGFIVHQAFLEYHAKANTATLKGEAALAKIFGFSLGADVDTLAASNAIVSHNRFYLDATYDLDCVYRLFYQDVNAHTPYLKETLDSIGRKAKIDLLDPAATNSVPRLVALRNDDTWKAMNECGNVTKFGLIPSLAKLQPTALGAISADWNDIRSWRDAMLKIAPALSTVLTAAANAKLTDPTSDATFMAAKKNLESVLYHLSTDTTSTFGDGWPLAVMYRVASASSTAPAQPVLEMTMSVNGKSQSQKSGEITKTVSGAA